MKLSSVTALELCFDWKIFSELADFLIEWRDKNAFFLFAMIKLLRRSLYAAAIVRVEVLVEIWRAECVPRRWHE